MRLLNSSLVNTPFSSSLSLSEPTGDWGTTSRERQTPSTTPWSRRTRGHFSPAWRAPAAWRRYPRVTAPRPPLRKASSKQRLIRLRCSLLENKPFWEVNTACMDLHGPLRRWPLRFIYSHNAAFLFLTYSAFPFNAPVKDKTRASTWKNKTPLPSSTRLGASQE